MAKLIFVNSKMINVDNVLFMKSSFRPQISCDKLDIYVDAEVRKTDSFDVVFETPLNISVFHVQRKLDANSGVRFEHEAYDEPNKRLSFRSIIRRDLDPVISTVHFPITFDKPVVSGRTFECSESCEGSIVKFPVKLKILKKVTAEVVYEETFEMLYCEKVNSSEPSVGGGGGGSVGSQDGPITIGSDDSGYWHFDPGTGWWNFSSDDRW